MQAISNNIVRTPSKTSHRHTLAPCACPVSTLLQFSSHNCPQGCTVRVATLRVSPSWSTSSDNAANLSEVTDATDQDLIFDCSTANHLLLDLYKHSSLRALISTFIVPITYTAGTHAQSIKLINDSRFKVHSQNGPANTVCDPQCTLLQIKYFLMYVL
jgi:hypothetical protein